MLENPWKKIEREIMEEKYSVKVICTNCGNLKIVKVPCGTPWEAGVEDVKCGYCKVDGDMNGETNRRWDMIPCLK